MRRIVLIIAFASLSGNPDNAHAQIIVAHRGASHDAPENTIAAFRLAWEQQADAIEGDFYLTTDKQIVCIHDRSTKRVAPQQCELIVAESTWACLRSVDVGSWKGPQYSGERIPTLKEVLDTVPDDKQVFVEIKCGPEILPVLKCQLCASGLRARQIVIICFDRSVVAEARKMMPQYKANWLTAYDKKTKQSDWTPNREDVLKSLQRTGATGLGTHGNLSVLDESFVDAVRAANKEFHVWTINEVADAKILKSLGVDSITTDRPAFIRNAIDLPIPIKDQQLRSGRRRKNSAATSPHPCQSRHRPTAPPKCRIRRLRNPRTCALHETPRSAGRALAFPRSHAAAWRLSCRSMALRSATRA